MYLKGLLFYLCNKIIRNFYLDFLLICYCFVNFFWNVDVVDIRWMIMLSEFI